MASCIYSSLSNIPLFLSISSSSNRNFKFKTFSLHHPVTNFSSSPKTKIWVNHNSAKSKPFRSKHFNSMTSFLLHLAGFLDSCDPTQEQVSAILNCLGDNKVAEQDAVFILDNMMNPKTAPVVLRYLRDKIHYVRYNEVVLYSVALKVFMKCNDFEGAQKVFDEMLQTGVKPDNITFTTMISMCPIPDKAVELFEKMLGFGCEPDAMTFSALIRVFELSGNYDECLNIHLEMKSLGVKPNVETYNILLIAVLKCKRHWQAKTIYQEMISNGVSPNFTTYSTLLHVYASAQCDQDALCVYKEMKGKGMNVTEYLYNVLLAMCAKVGANDEALEIFEDMYSSGTCVKSKPLRSKPFKSKTGFLLQLAASLDSCDPTQQQVSAILNCLRDNNVAEKEAVFILNNMMNPKNASVVLRFLRDKITYVTYNRVVLYNVTLKVFLKCMDFEGAQKVFDEMLQTGVKPDNITFTTMISMCDIPDKAVELFEKMPGFGCEPDAKTFSALIESFVLSGNYDECLNIHLEMKSLGVKPNVETYNSLLSAILGGKMHWQAKTIYQEMISNGVSPNFTTYSALLRVYVSAQYDQDALCVYKEMKGKGMDVTRDLYNRLLTMCAKVGANDEALEIFEDMNSSGTCHPDTWTFSALIDVYSNSGKVSEAEGVLNKMIKYGFEPNSFVMLSLAKCYGKAKQIDDVVNVLDRCLNLGIIPYDCFCGCLLNVMAQTPKEELGKLINCAEKVNTKHGYVVRYLVEGQDNGGDFCKDASELLNSFDANAKRPICNALINLCVNLNLPDRAHTLLSIGLMHGIYSSIQSRSQTKWSLDLKNLSIGAAMTAFLAWIADLSKTLESGEKFPPLLGINTGRRKLKSSCKGIASVIESHLKELNAPFHEDPNEAGWFLFTEEAAKSWLESRGSTNSMAALESMVLNAPSDALPY